MFDLDEYAKKMNQEALDRTANLMTKNFKEFEKDGVCFIKDLYSGTIFESSFSKNDQLYGFTDAKGQV